MLSIAQQIILSSKAAMFSEGMESLYAWGANIESFDAFIGIYYKDDKIYQETRSQYIKAINSVNSHDPRNKVRLFRYYNKWFALICRKLARFKIFPPLSVSYVQGLGEIQENG